jgi:predicted DNA-binding protein (MmcQ/YjbR family)
MTNDAIRAHCLSLPDTTEVVQWREHLLFKVGGKIFCMITLDGHDCSFRSDPEQYAELVEMEDIEPTSHNMWRYHWVTARALTALPERRFRELLNESYRIVRATLPKRVQAEMDGRSQKSHVGSPKSKVESRKPRAEKRKPPAASRAAKTETGTR